MKYTLSIILALGALAINAKVESHWDGGRNTPVHRIGVNDEFGDPIIPGTPNALPLSTRQTCGQCHDYDTIASGWHFNMSGTNTAPGRLAQPWFMIDAQSGTQIPMSRRDWPGTFKPAQLGMSDWEWTYHFGRHLPGGDAAEPADIYAEGAPHARWEVSGPMEINCFACHSHSTAYDHSEWVRLVLRENFRWAATGALGLGEVRGMGSRVADYWGVLRGPNRDDSVFAVPPHVIYDERQFDLKHRVVFEVGKPRSENCLNCHSSSQAGMPHKDIDGDVHLRAGMSCADCHSNGEDHAIARGCEGDPSGVMDKTRATASCVGCHLGTDQAQAGRYGAPEPKHVGIPVSHFKTLTCTACHSGVTENGELAQVRTSRANRMGVYGRARWATAQPYIMEPVFIKNDDGKIEPRRMVWPAYWGRRNADDPASIDPLRPELVQEKCQGLLDVREQAGTTLAILATDPNAPGNPVVAIKGKLFACNVDGFAVPLAETEHQQGYFYQTATNLIAVIPNYTPNPDFDKMSDEQLEAHDANEKKLSDLLQTLDAVPLALTNGCGAVAFGDLLFYRDSDSDSMVSTNLPAAVETPQLGWYKDGHFAPFISDYALANVYELNDSDCTITEPMVAAALKQLAASGEQEPLYVAHGQVWSLSADGQLTAKVERAAEPVSWSVGHDVRPARLARGAKPAKCADCHTVDAPFFFAKVTSTGPLLTTRTLIKAQNEFMGLSGSYNKVFGTTFLMRPYFKIFLWTVFALLALVAVAFVATAVPMLLEHGGIPYGRPSEQLVTLIDKAAALFLTAASVYLGCSGLLGWFFSLMTGYVLVFHMVAGGLFATCLLALIWTRGKRRINNARRNALWMLMLLLSGVVIFSAVAPMMTWFGEGWQWAMLWTHRLSGVAFLALCAWMLLTAGRKE